MLTENNIKREHMLEAYSHLDLIKAIAAKVLMQYGKLVREDVEDLSHDIVIKVSKGIDSFQQNAKIETWIGKITINHTISFLRSAKNKYMIESNQFENEEIYDYMGEQLSHNFNEYTMSPEQIYFQKERIEYLKSIIDNLNRNQLVAMKLLMEEDNSYADIANTMNTSLSCVKSLIFRAREKLKSYISA